MGPLYLRTRKQRRTKFGNKHTACLAKHVHDSRVEAEYCNRLLAMKKAGEIKNFFTQVTYRITLNDILICKHIVDFDVYTLDGRNEVHEVKGMKTAAWTIKHKLFMACYPDVKYVVISKGATHGRRTRQ